MKQRVWIIRLLLVLIMTAISLLVSLLLKNSYLVNYINTTFMLGLFFLVISGLSYTIIFGFWKVFSMGFKIIFNRGDESLDRSHWSYDKSDSQDDSIDLIRDRAKKELFIYLPLTVGLVLLLQSLIILFI